jgi:NADH-quinone oxidoreductase subunit M
VAIVAFGPRDPRQTGRWAMGFSLVALLATIDLPYRFIRDGIDAKFHFKFQCDFLPQLGSSLHLGADGISIWLVMLTSLLCVLSIWASFSAIKVQARSYYALMLLLQAGMTGVFVSMDLLIFYIFFEFTLLPLFLIVGIWGGSRRRAAAFKLFIYTMAGGVLTFAGIIYIGWYHQSHVSNGQWTFEIQQLYHTMPKDKQTWLFLAFFAGFAVKVPLFPFHTWLPLAHTEAPTAGSVLLAGVLLKLGTYGFLRISLPLLPDAAFGLAPLVAVLAIVGIIYGSLCAWVQTDIKKLVAYSSVAHLGFCMLGMFAFNHTGLSAALLYMINHGLSTGALFLVVGMIYERYHTREFAQLGGLARKMPIMAFMLILFTLSSIGLPGLNGFISEFGVLYAVFTSAEKIDQFAGPLGPTYAIIAAVGIILSAVYMLWMCQRVLFGPLKEPALTHSENEEKLPTDLSRREWSLLTPIAVLVILLGVYPRLYFASTDKAIGLLYQNIKTSQQQAANNNQPKLPEAPSDRRGTKPVGYAVYNK